MRSVLILRSIDPEDIAAALASQPDALLIGAEGLAALRGRTLKPRLYLSLTAAGAFPVYATLSGVALQGCSGGADVQRMSARLAVQEAQAGLAEGVLRIIAFAAETPDAVLDLSTYRGASIRLEAMVAGEAALRQALGARRGPVRMARDLTLLAAKAAGALALDGPYADADDLEGLREEAMAARADGFDGKVAIDPKQIRIIKEVFDTHGDKTD